MITTEMLHAVLAAVLFSALGAWIGDPIWAAAIGGAFGGLVTAAGEAVAAKKRNDC